MQSGTWEGRANMVQYCTCDCFMQLCCFHWDKKCAGKRGIGIWMDVQTCSWQLHVSELSCEAEASEVPEHLSSKHCCLPSLNVVFIHIARLFAVDMYSYVRTYMYIYIYAHTYTVEDVIQLLYTLIYIHVYTYIYIYNHNIHYFLCLRLNFYIPAIYTFLYHHHRMYRRTEGMSWFSCRPVSSYFQIKSTSQFSLRVFILCWYGEKSFHHNCILCSYGGKLGCWRKYICFTSIWRYFYTYLQFQIASGKLTVHYGKSPCYEWGFIHYFDWAMASRSLFVCLPEGTLW